MADNDAKTADTPQRATDQCASPSSEGRDEIESRAAINGIIRRRRHEFNLDTERVIRRLGVFARTLAQALGEVSREEAIDRLHAEAHLEFDKLRYAAKER